MNDTRPNVYVHECDMSYDLCYSCVSCEIKNTSACMCAIVSYCKMCVNLRQRIYKVRGIISNLEKARAPFDSIELANKDIYRMMAATNSFDI